MSASSTTLRGLPLEPTPLGYEQTPWVMAFCWVIISAALGFLGLAIASDVSSIASNWPVYLLWLVAIGLAELLSVPVWGSVVLTMSLPIVLAAGMVLDPVEVAPLAFLGCVDVRELRGEIGVTRALYNRAQVMLSVVAASAVFHSLDADFNAWPYILLATCLVVIVDFVVNAFLVAVPIRIHTALSLVSVVRRIFGVSPWEHALGHACLAMLALPLALTVQAAGGWALVAFLSPLLLVRQTFAHGRRLDRAVEMLESKNRAVASSSEHVASERRDERLLMAGGLHDDVMQPLYQVHLMGQVLQRDLDSGRLLDLDKDLPQLVDATNAAQAAIRTLIHGLRRSALGPDGLASTVRLLIRDLGSRTDAKLHLDARNVGGSATTQLLAYQILREALNNAVHHASADNIYVRLWREGDDVKLMVEDDGRGFHPQLIDGRYHFGLQMLSDRVEAGGGVSKVESQVGEGTRITASLPADETWRV
jgi:signal transduction histidine kinase